MNVHRSVARDEFGSCLHNYPMGQGHFKDIVSSFQDLIKDLDDRTDDPSYQFTKEIFDKCFQHMSELTVDQIDDRAIELIGYLGSITSDAQNLQTVEEALNKVLSENPSHVGALTQMGRLFYGGYDYESAVLYLKRALSLDPGCVDALLPLVDIFKKSVFDFSQPIGNQIQEGPREAVEYLEIAFRHNQDRRIFNTLICMLQYPGVPHGGQRVLEYLTQALERNSDDIDVLWAFAKLYRDGAEGLPENVPLAIFYLERILALNENDFEAIIWLADLYRIGCEEVPRNLRRSVEYLERAVHTYPRETKPLVILAEIYMEGGCGIETDLQRAVDYLQRALEIEKTDQMALRLIVEIYKTGGPGVPKNLQQAIVHLERALEKDPHFTPALTRLARIYEEGGEGVVPNPQQARHLWQRAGVLVDESDSDDSSEEDSESIGEESSGSFMNMISS